MTEPRPIVLLREKIARYQRDQEEYLYKGMAQDFAAYREFVGCIRTLDLIKTYIDESINAAAEGR